MATFREFLISEAQKEETKYNDIEVKSDKELADDAKKIKTSKKYSDIKVNSDKELADNAKKIK